MLLGHPPVTTRLKSLDARLAIGLPREGKIVCTYLLKDLAFPNCFGFGKYAAVSVSDIPLFVNGQTYLLTFHSNIGRGVSKRTATSMLDRPSFAF